MRLATALLAALILAPVFRLGAQAALYTRVGHRVRLKTNSASQWLIGTLVAADEDSLRLRVGDNAPLVSIARDKVSQFEIRNGGHSNVGKGALIGFGVAAFVGGVWGATSSRCPPTALICIDPGPGADAIVGAVVLGGVGVALGALVGSVKHGGGWEVVSLDRAHRLSLVPSGPGLALSLTF